MTQLPKYTNLLLCSFIFHLFYLKKYQPDVLDLLRILFWITYLLDNIFPFLAFHGSHIQRLLLTSDLAFSCIELELLCFGKDLTLLYD